MSALPPDDDRDALEALATLAEDVTLFAIISPPRAGSTLLCGLLDSHPDVICNYEVFHPNEVALSFRLSDRTSDISVRDVGALPFLANLLTRQHKQNPAYTAIGFKLQLSEFQINAGLEAVAGCRPLRKILLDRSNRLAAYASVWTAMATGVWQTTSRQDPSRGLLHFDHAHYRAYQERLDRDVALAERLIGPQPCLRLDYVDLLSRTHQARVLRYLDLPVEPMRADWVKTGTGSPLDVFDNPDEVIRAMTTLGRENWLTGEALPAA